MEMKFLRVLLSAYACEPGKGSEPGVGWNWVRIIASFVDEVWVITRANNREVIEQSLMKESLPNIHWIYFDLPRWACFWKKGQRGIHLYYYLWQIGIYLLAKRLHQKVGFNLVHHITFVNYWMPSFLPLLPVPFIWGPVGGGESSPKNFYKTFSWRGRMHEYTRRLVRWLSEHDPLVRLTVRKAIIALATTEETAKRLYYLGAKNVKVLSQIVLSQEEIDFLNSLPQHKRNPFRFISIGRLLHLKGFHLSIMAFAKLVQKYPQSEYWIVGDGPERHNLEWLARKLGVSDKVKFWGKLPREEALKKLGECNVLLHPSLHDSGGWVCVEAMAAGRPVICLDLGGPALQVTKETGFRIPARTPEQVVEEMAEAMKSLAMDEVLREKMSESAQKRVLTKFVWRHHREQIFNIYKQVLERGR